MVVPRFQKLFKWYPTISELKEIKKNPERTSTKSLDPPPNHEHHQQAAEQQQQPSKHAVVRGPWDIVPLESKWVVTIREKLEEARQIEASSSWEHLSIYRVPNILKDPAHEKSYIPQVVSLGPYHHGKSSLKAMEQHKWRALHHILKRHDQDIQEYLDAMKELEEKARACYERPVSCSSEEFVQMMVLDGCFMLELFKGAAAGFKALEYATNDPPRVLHE
ncbi:hypothetical protein Dimus_014280 [Dionaea muscipula]